MSICYNGLLQHYLYQTWRISICPYATMDGYNITSIHHEDSPYVHIQWMASTATLSLSNMENLPMCYNGWLQQKHYLYPTWRFSICPYATMDGFNSNITSIKYGESPHVLQWIATTLPLSNMENLHMSICYNGWLQQQHYLYPIWRISPYATMDGYNNSINRWLYPGALPYFCLDVVYTENS